MTVRKDVEGWITGKNHAPSALGPFCIDAVVHLSRHAVRIGHVLGH